MALTFALESYVRPAVEFLASVVIGFSFAGLVANVVMMFISDRMISLKDALDALGDTDDSARDSDRGDDRSGLKTALADALRKALRVAKGPVRPQDAPRADLLHRAGERRKAHQRQGDGSSPSLDDKGHRSLRRRSRDH